MNILKIAIPIIIFVPYAILRLFFIKTPVEKKNPTEAQIIEYNLLSAGDSSAASAWFISTGITLLLLFVAAYFAKDMADPSGLIIAVAVISHFIHYLVFRVSWSKYIHNEEGGTDG